MPITEKRSMPAVRAPITAVSRAGPSLVVPSVDRHRTALASVRSSPRAPTPAWTPRPGSVPEPRWSIDSIFLTTLSSASCESITVRGTSSVAPLENWTTVIAIEPSSGTFAGSRSAVANPSRCSRQSASSMLPDPSITSPMSSLAAEAVAGATSPKTTSHTQSSNFRVIRFPSSGRDR